MSCLVGEVVSNPDPAYKTYELPVRLTSLCNRPAPVRQRIGPLDGQPVL